MGPVCQVWLLLPGVLVAVKLVRLAVEAGQLIVVEVLLLREGATSAMDIASKKLPTEALPPADETDVKRMENTLALPVGNVNVTL
ncbi:hypothetical protein GCM10028817_40650 [Spirosoma pomorum]